MGTVLTNISKYRTKMPSLHREFSMRILTLNEKRAPDS